MYPLLALAIARWSARSACSYALSRRSSASGCATLFARFVPEAVVDEVLAATGRRPAPRRRRREGTVLFSDLRGFTSFSEALEPDAVIDVLNRYLAEMSDAILDHGGTLVAYMGDGIMAVFGAPLEQADHADRALAAAREMLGGGCRASTRRCASDGLGDGFRMGIGLNSGAGHVGQRRLPAPSRVHGDRRHHQHRRAHRGHDEGHAAPAVRRGRHPRDLTREPPSRSSRSAS